ncbi:hypothetical protein NPIL_245551 [Nephila pilipes]|uniref:Uncharacterized protein n=1 Tax=Nephila pilipes TaxID=299642 RepID=A0A8X6MRJ6_NEPPI|nr:hypothetical protein NPIL_245551 [Nephila pilipes]
MRQAIINTDVLDQDPVHRCMPTKCTKRLSGKESYYSASVATEMETIVSELDADTSNAREAGRCFGLPPSSICNILHGVLNHYSFKLQFYH